MQSDFAAHSNLQYTLSKLEYVERYHVTIHMIKLSAWYCYTGQCNTKLSEHHTQA